MIQYPFALVFAPFAVFVLVVALIAGTTLVGCNPYLREVGVTAEGEWSDLPEGWVGKVPPVGDLHEAFFANRDRARLLGACR